MKKSIYAVLAILTVSMMSFTTPTVTKDVANFDSQNVLTVTQKINNIESAQAIQSINQINTLGGIQSTEGFISKDKFKLYTMVPVTMEGPTPCSDTDGAYYYNTANGQYYCCWQFGCFTAPCPYC